MTPLDEPNSHPLDNLTYAVADVIRRFEAMSTARDIAVTDGRHVIRMAANAVRALHRGEDAAELLSGARKMMASIVEKTLPYPNLYWAGYVQDAMKEYAEAEITSALLHGENIPRADDLRVEDAAWLNGLAEAASELRRDVLDALRRDDTVRAESLLEEMDAVYSVLVTVDFPDAVTGGLRRTTDQFRGVLERTRGDVTISVRQSRLEHALRSFEAG